MTWFNKFQIKRELLNIKIPLCKILTSIIYSFCSLSGAAGGLAFGMIVLGIVLTIVGIFVYFKATGKGVDDMRIQFSKQVDEE